ncbi:MAG: hypothetical protein ABIP48_30615 [Planctomycetota bacterium]
MIHRKLTLLFRPAAGLLLAAFLAAVGSSPAARAQQLKTARLLPEKTAVLLWFPNAPEAAERFMNTALGRIGRDPQIRPLVDQFRESLSASMESEEKGIGLSLSELLALPQGELTLAVVAPEKGGPALVVLVDTGDQVADARKLLDRMSHGTGRREVNIFDTRIVVQEGSVAGQQQLMFLEKEDTLVVSTNMEVLKQVLAAWNGQELPTIGGNKKFGAIMRRSREQNPRPQFVWYVDPILLLRSMGERNPGLQMGLAMFPVLGLDGVRAFGGGIEWDTGRFDSMTHVHLLLTRPDTGILKVLALRSGETTPEGWVPADVSTYTTMHWDLLAAFTALREVFDGFRGEGALSKALQQWVGEPTGLDFENDLLPALTGRMTRITRVDRPGTPRGRSTLFAWELKPGSGLGAVLETISRDRGEALSRLSHSGKTYYQYSSPTSEADAPARASLPRPYFGVLDNCLIVADRESLYQTVIDTAAGSGDRLADALDFKLVASRIRDRSGGAEPAMVRFARPEEDMRSFYELVGADQTRGLLSRQAERNTFSRALHSAVGGDSLPPFSVLENYLAPGGGLLTVDEEGIHYTGITLRRK